MSRARRRPEPARDGAEPAGDGTADERQALRSDAATLGVALGEEQARKLLRLLDELARWNRAYNLTALVGRAAMIRGHLLDSLAAAPMLAGTRIADIGCGAGFPGLPLAIAAPERHFTLIDSVQKKIRFVAHAARLLQLANVTPLAARVESVAPPVPFDTLIARAFAPLPALLTAVDGLAGAAVRVVALKGRYPQPELAQLPAGWQVEQVLDVHIPGLAAERHLVRLVRLARQRVD